MEIKITISDTGGGGTATVTMQINGESVGPRVESSTAGRQHVAPSPETLRAAVGAIDAGRAPTAGGATQFGAPQPFISGTNEGVVTTSPEIWGSPAAALPG